MSLVLRNGAEVIARSAHEPDRFRGPNLSGAWLDEASLISRDAYSNLLPCLSAVESSGEVGTDGLADGDLHAEGNGSTGPTTYSRSRSRVATRLACRRTKASSRRVRENPFLPPGVLRPHLLKKSGRIKMRRRKPRRRVHGRRARLDLQVEAVSLMEATQAITFGLLIPGVLERSITLSQCRIFLMVDLASSLRQSADRTAIGVYADDGHGNLIVLDMVAERMESPEITKVIWQKFVQWGAKFVGIEAVGAQMLFVQAEREKGLPVEALTRQRGEDHVGRSRYRRRCDAKPARYSFRTNPEMKPWWPPFKDELLQFPVGDHDDRVDTLSDAAQWMVRHYRGYGMPLTYRFIGQGVSMQRAADGVGGVRALQ